MSVALIEAMVFFFFLMWTAHTDRVLGMYDKATPSRPAACVRNPSVMAVAEAWLWVAFGLAIAVLAAGITSTVTPLDSKGI